MTQVPCPRCGSYALLHYVDAYVIRKPVLDDDGKLKLTNESTTEYDDSFFDCDDCGFRYEGDQLPPTTSGEGARAGES